MSGSTSIKSILSYDWQKALPVLRYAFGSTLILAISAGSAHSLAYITPVLALNFFAPGVPPFTFKAGIGFLTSLLIACFLAFMFGRLFLGER